MAISQRSRTLIEILSLAAIYLLAGKLGLRLASANPSATAVWPCTGITLSAFLILGSRVWPGIFLGAFLVNVTTAGSVATSLGIALGNTLEGVAGWYLVRRFAGGLHVFERAQDIFKFAFFAGMVCTTVSATLGVTTLALNGLVDWGQYGSIWCTWWLGDGVGAVLVTPLVLLWRENPRLHWTQKQIVELMLLFLGLFFTSWVVFGGRFSRLREELPPRIPLRPFSDLGGFPVWSAQSGHRDLRACGNGHLGHIARFRSFLQAITGYVASAVARVHGNHGHNNSWLSRGDD
jgi:integral membrane sensor domain MASE1